MKKFLAIWVGQLIATIGSGMTAFALSVYVYLLTKSVTYVSVVALLSYLPVILLNPIGGLLADRFDRRLMMIIGELFSALGLVYILIHIETNTIGIVTIFIGVIINAVFVSLLDPSYKATVTDLLTEEEYSQASGLVQMASNARYLISPAIAGFILMFTDIRWILIIDISTILISALAVLSVKRTIRNEYKERERLNFREELKEGLSVITKDKGLTRLVFLMALVCFFMGFIQTLMIPMVLPFASVRTVGLMESISAMGMLVGSLAISFIGIKKNHQKILTRSLLMSGLFMALVGSSTSMVFILLSCILFFCALPFVNTCADVLIRVRIPNELQGRVWGLISLLTQLGFVIAYMSCGILADQVFEPLVRGDGILSNSIGRVIGTGEGRGIGLMLIIAGLFMMAIALMYSKENGVNIERKEYDGLQTN